MNKQEFFIPFENENLHCILWRPDGECRAVLQIVHGMVEYIGRYEEFANHLCSLGIAVAGHDHPGHGKTARSTDSLGYIPKKGGSELLLGCTKKVTDFVKETFPGVPNFILGHSMGSFVVRRFLTAYGDSVSGAVIVGTGTPPRPLLTAGKALTALLALVKGEKSRSKLLTDISFSGYNSRFSKDEGIHAWISSDRDVVKRYDSDPFCTYTFTVGGFSALYGMLLFLSMETDIENIPKNLPILITAGGDDPVGDYSKGPRKLYSRYKALGIKNTALKIYDGQRHEIINEKDREKVHGDLSAWILAQTEK